jgi:hypothetical protein
MRSMPLFLMRDGSVRRLSVLPEGVNTWTYRDRFQRKVHAVLEARGEATLLAAQPASTGAVRHRAPLKPVDQAPRAA